MVATLDLKAELAKIHDFAGPYEREGAFTRLAPYRDGAIFTGKFFGESPRERHPNGDEIV